MQNALLFLHCPWKYNCIFFRDGGRQRPKKGLTTYTRPNILKPNLNGENNRLSTVPILHLPTSQIKGIPHYRFYVLICGISLSPTAAQETSKRQVLKYLSLMILLNYWCAYKNEIGTAKQMEMVTKRLLYIA